MRERALPAGVKVAVDLEETLKPITPIPTVYNPDNESWANDTDDEHLFWPRCVWLDCGVETGVAVIWFDPRALLNPTVPLARSILAWHVNWTQGRDLDQQARQLLRLVRGLGGPEGLAVGAESFQARRIDPSEDFLSSPVLAGKVEFGLKMGVRDWDGKIRQRPLLRQGPSEIASAQGDARLQALRLWVPGKDHRRDALKHCLQHLGKMRAAGMGQFEMLYGWNPEWENA